MQIIVVMIGKMVKCPPAISVIQVLSDLGHKVIVCTTNFEKEALLRNFEGMNNITFEYPIADYEDNVSLPKKLIRMLKIRKNLWDTIEKYYDDETLLWVISEVAVKHLGKKLLGKRYILHELELIEGMYYISGNPIFKLDAHEYASKALAVVEAEYNRAHITKAWWNLDRVPFVLPNKPYKSANISKHSSITSRDDVAQLMEMLQGKKIVLYQGNISKERPLDKFILAVDELGDEYAFIMMLNGNNPYPELKTKNCYFVPFIAPPFHLEVTSNAYIGVLSYVPVKNSYSILNTLFCAPNKIWEYTKFGVPMISNDLPALTSQFQEKHIGKTISEFSVKRIKEAILEIDKDYTNYSLAAKEYYGSIDVKEIIESIIAECKTQM